MEKIQVVWEVSDGYVGKSRPQKLEIDIENDVMSEEEWVELSHEEKLEVINEAVQDDFERTVSFSITDYGI